MTDRICSRGSVCSTRILYNEKDDNSTLEIATALEIPGNATYDYVIVGGGTAGDVIALRLAEDPNNRMDTACGTTSSSESPTKLNIETAQRLTNLSSPYTYAAEYNYTHNATGPLTSAAPYLGRGKLT
jgi:hypothetical protein